LTSNVTASIKINPPETSMKAMGWVATKTAEAPANNTSRAIDGTAITTAPIRVFQRVSTSPAVISTAITTMGAD